MSSSVQELASNEPETFLGSSELLLKYVQNILDHPLEQRYRRVRIGNQLVEKHLLTVPGGMQCLFEMGFQEDGDYLTLPMNSPLQRLRKMKEELLVARSNITTQPSESNRNTPNAPASSRAVTSSSVITGNSGITSDRERANANLTLTYNSAQLQLSEREMEARIRASFSHAHVYKSQNLQEKARAIVPRSELMQLAETRLLSEGLEHNWLRDRYLLELLAWFKSSFFQWTNLVKCESCGGDTTNQGVGLPPSPEELRHGATRVEGHNCLQCGTINRFPRYNNPGRLLETRHGRCGEWANCFTLICIAEGFEARHVVDWTDHVWTEVYSEVRGGRWIHLDPCENSADQPLLYEVGWGKKLTYVIAFAIDDIQDVTWRYTSHHAETLKLRTLCREEWLVGLILRLRAERHNSLPHERRRVLLDRTISELVEFLLEPSNSQGQLGGRTTGSLEWRQARGELGSTPQASITPVTIKPNPSEIKLKLIAIKYSCALDEYIRGLNAAGDLVNDISELSQTDRNNFTTENIKGWQSLAHKSSNIARKVELDWKQAYLARKPAENNSIGTLEWKFDFSGTSLVVDWLRVEFTCECFSTGKVVWTLCGDDQCLLLDNCQSGTKIEGLEGSGLVHITAQLRGGEGDVAWQHAQLFRQSSNDSTPFYPFRIVIKLKTVQ